MRFYLFLRSLIWTKVISLKLALLSIISAFIPVLPPTLPLLLGMASITFALLALPSSKTKI